RDGPGGLYRERIGLARDRLEDESAWADGKRRPRRDLSRANPRLRARAAGDAFRRGEGKPLSHPDGGVGGGEHVTALVRAWQETAAEGRVPTAARAFKEIL